MNKLCRCSTLLLLFVISAVLTLPVGAGAQSAAFAPIRPPSVPLITRSPYVSTWLHGSAAPGTWPGFWNGNIKAITGMASIDGSAYLFMGAPGGIPHTMSQTQLQVTPTQSIYTFTGGGVAVTVDFLSPVEAGDMRRLSIPLGDITATANSTDGRAHTVSLYFDISGEWAHGDSAAPIVWKPEGVARSADGSGTSGSLTAWEVTPSSPSVLAETNDYPEWGVALLATAVQPNLTSQSGQDSVVRGQFVSHGILAGANDTNQPRAIDDNWPVFAYSLNLGTVSTPPSAPFTLLLGHVRDPAVSYQGQNVPSLWKSYFGTYETMLAFALNDAPAALTRANAFDLKLTQAATAVGGTNYAALCSLALRQAFAGTELVDPTGVTQTPQLGGPDPWLFLKEISSDGNVSTVDVVYPAFPAFLYTNPELVRYLIDPLLYYPESGKWPQPFAEHDLGASYPNADGHNDGGGENMPVEETANLLIMADAYMRYTHVPARATAYAQAHYAILKQWANYLLAVPSGVNFSNALDPQFQNQTDDFTGQIAHSANLSLKGIIAVGAMGQIAACAGNTTDAAYYASQAQFLIGQWAQMAQNSSATHLLLQYREPANSYSADTTGEPDSAWSLKYNAFPDKLLGTHLLPAGLLTEEANFYKTQENPYGIPLDYRNPYTKADWELWTAAATGDATLRQNIIDEVYGFANTTPNRVPFTDWYYPDTAAQAGFQARPVIGGVFAPLLTAPRSVSVVAALQGVQPGNLAQPLVCTLTPTGGTPGVVTTQTVTPAASDGSFTLSGVPAGTYTLGVKGGKWLRRDVAIDTTGGSVTGLSVPLLGGDVSGHNQVSLADLAALRAAYGSHGPSASGPASPGWNPQADLTCDGQVSLADLAILRANYGKAGDR